MSVVGFIVGAVVMEVGELVKVHTSVEYICEKLPVLRFKMNSRHEKSGGQDPHKQEEPSSWRE